MKKGGYKIVDFKKIEVNDTTETKIGGVYNAIKNSNGKPILISGLNYEGNVYNDFFVNPVFTEGYITLKISESYNSTAKTMTYTDLIIASDNDVIIDVVTITSYEESNQKIKKEEK